MLQIQIRFLEFTIQGLIYRTIIYGLKRHIESAVKVRTNSIFLIVFENLSVTWPLRKVRNAYYLQIVNSVAFPNKKSYLFLGHPKIYYISIKLFSYLFNFLLTH